MLDSPSSSSTPPTTSPPSTPSTAPPPASRARGPGKRGPAPTACDGCRRFRSKCVRRNGAKLGEEPCVRCEQRDLRCVVAQTIARRSTPVPLAAERALVDTQICGLRATKLWNLFFDTSTVGLELNVISRLIHDSPGLQARFEASGRNLDIMSSDDKLQCRLIWAAASRRWSDALENPTVGQQVLKTAQRHADDLAIWRIATVTNLTSLLLFYYVVAFGDLTSVEAEYYLRSACVHAQTVFPDADSLFNHATGVPIWPIWATSITDVARALETRTMCFLSDQVFSILANAGEPTYLPPFDLLSSFLPQEASKVTRECTHAINHCVYTGRLLVRCASRRLEETSTREVFDTLQVVWDRLDTYHFWIRGCHSLLASTSASSISSSDSAILKTSFVIVQMPSTLLEFFVLSYLKDRLLWAERTSESPAQVPSASSELSAIASLRQVADARATRALCIFLRDTRNRDGIYLLVAAAGHQCSCRRLADLATSLFHADSNDFDLFPLGSPDKLASVTSLQQALKNVQVIYRTPELTDSIASLASLRQDLENETGYSGESALTLFTSVSLDNPLEIPATPSFALVRAAISIQRGSQPI